MTLRHALATLTLALSVSSAGASVALSRVGEYRSGAPLGSGAAEIVAARSWVDPGGVRRLRAYVTNAGNRSLDVINFDNPALPSLERSIDVSIINGFSTGGPSSVAVDPLGRGIAVAVGNQRVELPGWAVLMDFSGSIVATYEVGAVSDSITFTPDGRRVLVCNEGEPNEDYSIDTEGSVSIIDISGGFAGGTTRTARLQGVPEAGPVRHAGPSAATPWIDFEPETLTLSEDGRTGYVSLQEANAIGILDVEAAQFTLVQGLGWKDHSLPGAGFDGSDADGIVNIRPWPVRGQYMPDHTALLVAGGRTYLFTANEGDPRTRFFFRDTAAVESLILEAPLTLDLRLGVNLGSLIVDATQGDANSNGRYEALYSFGTRSFSAWDLSDMTAPAWDSGDQFEQVTAAHRPDRFNADSEVNNSFDARSRSRGPEPEGLVLGEVCGTPYVFIGLERFGGVMVYDVTDPEAPVFVQYATSRNFDLLEDDPAVGGLAPEGLAFVSADQSPNEQALLIMANEVSGTLEAWAIIPTTPCVLPPEHCTNGIDDDGDTLVDCDDPDCLNDPTVDCDGDGEPNGTDCAPLIATTWRLPGPVSRLDVERAAGDSGRVTWTYVAPAGGPAEHFDIATGEISALRPDAALGSPFSRATCREDMVLEFIDTSSPAVRPDGAWYLVRAENACGDSGTWGTNSFGIARSVTACP